MATFGAQTLRGYIDTWVPRNDYLEWHFPGTNTNKVHHLGRGPTKIAFKGFAATEAEWNSIRGVLTDGARRTLTYKDARASATSQKMDCFAQLTDARPLGTGWEYSATFTAEDPVPKDSGTSTSEY